MNKLLNISNVADNPDTVGFGFNVTITAYVNDSESGVDTVRVNVTYPKKIAINQTLILPA